MCAKRNPLNCWKTLKLTYHSVAAKAASATVTKVERKVEIAQGQILNAIAMGNQQRSSENSTQKLQTYG